MTLQRRVRQNEPTSCRACDRRIENLEIGLLYPSRVNRHDVNRCSLVNRSHKDHEWIVPVPHRRPSSTRSHVSSSTLLQQEDHEWDCSIAMWIVWLHYSIRLLPSFGHTSIFGQQKRCGFQWIHQ